MTNDPNHPWHVLPKADADRFSHFMSELGAHNATPKAVNEACDAVVEYGRRRFHEGVRLGNQSVLGRNGMALGKFMPEAIEACWPAAPHMNATWFAHYMFYWAVVQELHRVSLRARTLDTFEPPTVAEFLANVQQQARVGRDAG